ncbi:MAG TPA: isoprenylcysteine carboxylmethyltransferase family protein, partial [Symbiobacteriaceae bacterium]|nr:isoprenylcysteine carboxylmethyltransferase family protein [Symbiobacteriaceae bacterium]
MKRRMIQVLVVLLAMGAVLFGSAGRMGWGMAWAYLGFYVALLAVNAAIFRRKDPDLLKERGEFHPDAKPWDQVLAPMTSLFGLVAILLVAGLEQRYRWSPGFPLLWQVLFQVVVATGYTLLSWAMFANRFFSSVVRIQTERGHSVATGGPYRAVRHPGYVGMLIYTLATPVALNAPWA